jgi:hypothetical protein
MADRTDDLDSWIALQDDLDSWIALQFEPGRGVYQGG